MARNALTVPVERYRIFSSRVSDLSPWHSTCLSAHLRSLSRGRARGAGSLLSLSLSGCRSPESPHRPTPRPREARPRRARHPRDARPAPRRARPAAHVRGTSSGTFGRRAPARICASRDRATERDSRDALALPWVPGPCPRQALVLLLAVRGSCFSPAKWHKQVSTQPA